MEGDDHHGQLPPPPPVMPITEEVLVKDYLGNKINGRAIPSGLVVKEEDVYSKEPWHLVPVPPSPEAPREAFFFSKRVRLASFSERTRHARAAGAGNWKPEGESYSVFNDGASEGHMRRLSFKIRGNQRKKKTDSGWIMYEYELDGSDDVLCLIKFNDPKKQEIEDKTAAADGDDEAVNAPQEDPLTRREQQEEDSIPHQEKRRGKDHEQQQQELMQRGGKISSTTLVRKEDIPRDEVLIRDYLGNKIRGEAIPSGLVIQEKNVYLGLDPWHLVPEPDDLSSEAPTPRQAFFFSQRVRSGSYSGEKTKYARGAGAGKWKPGKKTRVPSKGALFGQKTFLRFVEKGRHKKKTSSSSSSSSGWIMYEYELDGCDRDDPVLCLIKFNPPPQMEKKD